MRPGQVYQPTTCTLPQDSKAWVPSFLPQSNTRFNTMSKFLILGFSTTFAIIGLIMIIAGSTATDTEGSAGYITLLSVGVLLLVAAILAFLIYFRYLGYYIPCCPGKIARIRKHLEDSKGIVKGQYAEGDQPISAQYGPPKQPTNPTNFTDASEQQRLMEEKQVETGDESEKILNEEDPRIVLGPLKCAEEC